MDRRNPTTMSLLDKDHEGASCFFCEDEPAYFWVPLRIFQMSAAIGLNCWLKTSGAIQEVVPVPPESL